MVIAWLSLPPMVLIATKAPARIMSRQSEGTRMSARSVAMDGSPSWRCGGHTPAPGVARRTSAATSGGRATRNRKTYSLDEAHRPGPSRGRGAWIPEGAESVLPLRPLRPPFGREQRQRAGSEGHGVETGRCRCDDGCWRELLWMEQPIEGTLRVRHVRLGSVHGARQNKQKRCRGDNDARKPAYRFR